MRKARVCYTYCYSKVDSLRPCIDPDFADGNGSTDENDKTGDSDINQGAGQRGKTGERPSKKGSIDEFDDDDTEDSDINQDAKRKRKTGQQPSKKKARIGRDDVASLRKATWDFPMSQTRGDNEVETYQTRK
jgi:hypothetical protein